MTILITGSTGNIGSRVVQHLAQSKLGLEVRALIRNAEKAKLPANVQPVTGDMTDVSSMRKALEGVDTLFLLNGVVPDETVQALLTLDVASEMGVKNLVYFSIFNSHLETAVPHMASKFLAERQIEKLGIAATILKPAFFMQNDLMMLQAFRAGFYPQPVGNVGIASVDLRDVAEIAALELIRRETGSAALPSNRIEIVGPDVLKGVDLAAIWAKILKRDVQYAGDDLAAFEGRIAGMMPSWLARDLRLMFRSFQTLGILPQAGVVANLETMLGRRLRTFEAFAREAGGGS